MMIFTKDSMINESPSKKKKSHKSRLRKRKEKKNKKEKDDATSDLESTTAAATTNDNENYSDDDNDDETTQGSTDVDPRELEKSFEFGDLIKVENTRKRQEIRLAAEAFYMHLKSIQNQQSIQ